MPMYMLISLSINFIWNGQDKIKHLAMINDIEKGGFRMTCLDSAIKAQRILFLKRYRIMRTALGNTF